MMHTYLSLITEAGQVRSNSKQIVYIYIRTFAQNDLNIQRSLDNKTYHITSYHSYKVFKRAMKSNNMEILPSGGHVEY